MNILKKTIAPITELAWREISRQADNLLKIYLTGRKFVDINGPNGLEMGGLSTGRLIIPGDGTHEGINFGIREMVPLTEIRRPFDLNIWELDNIERGAKDIDLAPLEEAARDLAVFEETTIYKGFPQGNIKGLEECSSHSKIPVSEDHNAFLSTIADQIISLEKEGVQGPYTLILNNNRWQKLETLTKGYPLMKELSSLIKGQVIVNYFNDNSYLISERGGDYELTLGLDTSIGYNMHTPEKVNLYLTQSFTFRVLSPEAICVLTDN